MGFHPSQVCRASVTPCDTSKSCSCRPARSSQIVYILFIGIRTLWRSVTPGYGDHSPLTTAAILEWRLRSDLESAAAARRGRREGVPVRLGGAGRLYSVSEGGTHSTTFKDCGPAQHTLSSSSSSQLIFCGFRCPNIMPQCWELSLLGAAEAFPPFPAGTRNFESADRSPVRSPV
jgi:hypothetical protein